MKTVDKEKKVSSLDEVLALGQGEKVISIGSLHFKIRKISIGDFSNIMNVTKDNQAESIAWIAFKGIVDPHMTIDQVKSLPVATVSEIAFEIQEYSGLDKEFQEKIKNLSEKTKPTQ